jgi:hypothetical protein
MGLVSFQDNDKFFVKFFLLDASLNLNQWGVTSNALQRDLHTFIGKPFVWKPEFNHPDATSGEHLLQQQENYRAGDITSVGIDESTGKAWGIAEIFDKAAIESIKNGEVNFVSPSIVFNRSDTVRLADGSQVIDKYEAAHVAAVADPAYGMQKAQIKGKCSGDSETCETNLARVQASKDTKKAIVTPSKCGKYLRVEQGSKVFVIAKASDCVEKCIQEKADNGVEIDDQAIAVCFSECGEKKAKNANVTENCNDPKINCDPLAEVGKKDAKSSLNDKTNDKKVTMTKAEEDKKLDEEAEMEEEDKTDATKKAEDEKEDHNQGEEEDKEEAEEDDKEEAEEEEKEDAEEEDKEEASLRKQVASMKKQLASIKSSAIAEKKAPLIKSIVEAKSKLGKVNASVEAKSLAKYNTKTLESLKADYEKIIDHATQKNPRYSVVQASVNSSNKSGDDFIKNIRKGEMN